MLEVTCSLYITPIKTKQLRKDKHRGGKLARNIEVLLQLASLPMANQTPKCHTLMTHTQIKVLIEATQIPRGYTRHTIAFMYV